jgi:hypothetical protein
MPHAPYVLRDAEKAVFLHLISTVKTPTGHNTANIGRQVSTGKLSGLKSHDYHVLMQQLLPACIRHFMAEGPRNAVIRLGNVFRMICSRVVNPTEIPNLKLYTAETLCMLEMWFPLAFFDVMNHLISHLVEELDICGPVHTRWMYGVERYLAIGYSFEESLGFITEHLLQFPHTQRQVWDTEQDEMDSGEVLQGRGTVVQDMSEADLMQLHTYVIMNSFPTVPLLRYELR